jgi:hypothetical protein
MDSSNSFEYYPWWQVYPTGPRPYEVPEPMWTNTYQTVPTECSGDVHVFACKKCGECKCGKAKIAKAER